jgi:predicted nucleic acid-binding protein
MILVDTNILIAVIRATDPTHLIHVLQKHGGAVCGIVRAELLHGVRTAQDRLDVITLLATLAANFTLRKRSSNRHIAKHRGIHRRLRARCDGKTDLHVGIHLQAR